MTKEELEKYIDKKVEITLGEGGSTYKGKLVKRNPEFMKVICDAYGVDYKYDWFTLILKTKESIIFRAKYVKNVKRSRCKL